MIARVDYGMVLPLIARMPYPIAKYFIWLRGTVNYLFDWEWRTLALGHGYVRDATRLAMQEIHRQSGSYASASLATWGRFVCSSKEEYDAQRLGRMNFEAVKWESEGLDAIISATRAGRGVVLMTGHFDSLYVGLVLLARQGVRVNLMSSKVMGDPRVPAPIQKFFRNKTDALVRELDPGQVLSFEDGMHTFVKALRRGEVVVIACDGPTTTSKHGSAVRFLGNNYVMAPGPEFLARAADADISMYACVRQANGAFRLGFSTPLSVSNGGVQRAFDCLNEKILRHPQCWWAADLYRTYQVGTLEEDIATLHH